MEKRYLLNFIATFIIATTILINSVYAEIGRIDYDVDVVDVVSREIIVSQYVYVNVTTDGEVVIPLVASLMNVTYEILSLTTLRNGVEEKTSYHIDVERNALLIYLKRGFNVLTIDYVVNGVIEETAPLRYVLIINITKPQNASLRLRIDFPLRYNVTPILTPQNYSLTTTPSYTRFESTVEGFYIILIEKTMEIGVGTKTTPTAFSAAGRHTLLFIALALALVSVGFATYWFKFRRKLELEATPADILSDDTVKKMIIAIGDGGENGVKQSDLVRIVGRPKSAVSRRLKRLAEEGYVTITPRGKYNIVKLTSKGYSVYREFKKKG